MRGVLQSAVIMLLLWPAALTRASGQLGGKVRVAPAVVLALNGALYTVKADGTDRHRITVSGPASLPELGPGGNRVAYVAGRTTTDKSGNRIFTPTALRVVSLRGGSGHTVAVVHGPVSRPAWSPDGLRLAWGDGRRLRIAPAAGGRVLTVVTYPRAPVQNWPAELRWSPDGSQLAVPPRRFCGASHADLCIGIVSSQGGPVRPIVIHFPTVLLRPGVLPPGSLPGGRDVAWTADNQHLLLGTGNRGAGDFTTGIWLAQVNGGDARLLVGTASDVGMHPPYSPSLQSAESFLLSPDSTLLATDPIAVNAQNLLWVAHADGTRGRLFSTGSRSPCALTQARWLNDSRTLAFVVGCPRSGTPLRVAWSLRVLDTRSGLVRRLWSEVDGDRPAIDLARVRRCVLCV